MAVARIRVASNTRFRDSATNEWKDGDSLFLTCNIWREQGENVAESLRRGMRVILQGRLKQRSYETSEGEKRTIFEVDVDEIAPSLRNAIARVTKANRTQQAPEDPWATSSAQAPAPDQNGAYTETGSPDLAGAAAPPRRPGRLVSGRRLFRSVSTRV
ncbi:single-strand DNA-binding protein [Nonomuraea soli]|uniref:Single-stranded DNA-binding protein n=1 Tax=Nonomuraea soli TaxID=1032476 RepID=A0A7W0CUU7_9ACTN|nr:single-strand DNA-binding protein [Nonomuraea soli]